MIALATVLYNFYLPDRRWSSSSYVCTPSPSFLVAIYMRIRVYCMFVRSNCIAPVVFYVKRRDPLGLAFQWWAVM